jgi:hypothetical protein
MEATIKLGEERHIYLYAKNHYKRTDVVEDLKILVGHITGIEAKHISVDNAVYWCLKLAHKAMQSESRPFFEMFYDFILDVSPGKCWKIGYYTKDCPYVYERAIAHKCLSILTMVSVKDNYGNIILDLGKADANILPLRIK